MPIGTTRNPAAKLPSQSRDALAAIPTVDPRTRPIARSDATPPVQATDSPPPTAPIRTIVPGPLLAAGTNPLALFDSSLA
jgi:hypothetical protein